MSRIGNAKLLRNIIEENKGEHTTENFYENCLKDDNLIESYVIKVINGDYDAYIELYRHMQNYEVNDKVLDYFKNKFDEKRLNQCAQCARGNIYFLIGFSYYRNHEGKYYNKVIEYYGKSEKEDNADACYSLADILYNGIRVNTDRIQAKFFYEKAQQKHGLAFSFAFQEKK
jgi:TPR repeat protein